VLPDIPINASRAYGKPLFRCDRHLPPSYSSAPQEHLISSFLLQIYNCLHSNRFLFLKSNPHCKGSALLAGSCFRNKPLCHSNCCYQSLPSETCNKIQNGENVSTFCSHSKCVIVTATLLIGRSDDQMLVSGEGRKNSLSSILAPSSTRPLIK
jgi:hypothetical protein